MKVLRISSLEEYMSRITPPLNVTYIRDNGSKHVYAHPALGISQLHVNNYTVIETEDIQLLLVENPKCGKLEVGDTLRYDVRRDEIIKFPE